MGAEVLSSRAIIGEFYNTLEQDTGASWVDALSMYFLSDQESESYKWLGMAPAMQEWIGKRMAKGFNSFGIDVANLHFEASIEFALKDLRRDKSRQVFLRIQELAERTNAHWASLLSALIIAGESQVCYDGQYFFDTDHVDGDSGAQSNDLTTDISGLPVPTDEQGSVTAPGARVMKAVILKTIHQILSFKDDRGEPMNENARRFLVMTPISLYDVANAAVTSQVLGGFESNDLRNNPDLEISVVPNVRLPWTDKIAVFRTDGRTKAFIRQEESEVMIKAKAEGSEFEFDNDAHQYGVDSWRNVGFGYWQKACLNQMV